ncbi:Succinate dehydrogenase cytochrome B subunit, mitochondrial [Schizosaccharomyces pombe]|uniref:Succinate dehydrogenase cytochrome B subunit, mitochondrial n=1 Tax=Schizosaccharomyces pombe (strain 972 / ATCC 24843) TaxID=284812 RepID=SDH3_SCHPO|nr:succinate dehydrogenase cytochrome B subunit [Schizosaccharomyces pombe]O74882.1 RecName: Full=Succinate dehydrogenase cytochrome B subunit, mitochondrial; Flags: Precursor [Schizosaccharomyces pombe 972h-]CAA20917.1 succinate dehydrogenase (ubiquinone) cytochrome b subunit (predicted) [Schizosaccharomyces pombe]|eukprot:NP_587712.1 succinate dehydrogenase cytochrome B subunit [Schizosaccharomyces pombe]
MFATRSFCLSSSLFRPAAQLLRPAGRSTLRNVWRRSIATEHLTQTEANSRLASQRVHRPNSPHLTIYEPQLTWYLSSLHRITGCVVAGTLYAFAMGYLVAPLAGYSLDTATISGLIQQVPTWIKVPAKFVISYPLTFHIFNGIRHLIWDTTKELSLKGVYRTGYAVLALSVLTSGYFAMI